MKSSDPPATIGDVAERFGLPTHVLRHWESVGLLAPGRDRSGHRTYGRPELERIAMIRLGKEAGLSLTQLRVLLAGPDPMQHAGLLRRHVAELERRIAEATAAKELLEHALACPLPFAECPHAREQISSRIPDVPGERPAGPDAGQGVAAGPNHRVSAARTSSPAGSAASVAQAT